MRESCHWLVIKLWFSPGAACDDEDDDDDDDDDNQGDNHDNNDVN